MELNNIDIDIRESPELGFSVEKIEWPEHIAAIEEIKVISDLVDKLTADIKEAIDNLNADIDIETATENGIKRREKIYGIKPLDSDTLEDRRFRLKARLSDPMTYTEDYIREWLTNLMGEDYTLTVDYQNYTFDLKIPLAGKSELTTVTNYMQAVIPLHMQYKIALKYNLWSTVTAGKNWQDMTAKTWQYWKEEVI